MKSQPVIDPSVLLQHRSWLQRLARSLTRDPEAASDLVQDAWVAALVSAAPGSVSSSRAICTEAFSALSTCSIRTRSMPFSRMYPWPPKIWTATESYAPV